MELFPQKEQSTWKNTTKAIKYGWKSMIISCSICGEETENIIAAYNHSRERHYQEVKAKDQHTSTCILCGFNYGNPAIVKVHSEIAHTSRRQKVYLQHPKTVGVYEHLRELQRQELFHKSLKAFFV